MLKITIISWLDWLMRRNIISAACAGTAFSLLLGCNTTSFLSTDAPPNAPTGLVATLPSGFFVPTGIFSKRTSDVHRPSSATSSPITSIAINSSATTYALTAQTNLRVPLVWLYSSSTTQAYFATVGLDAKVNSQLWEIFLQKYKIPFQRITSVDQLEKVQPGVLVLPSTVAMSERERRSIINFRAKGGGVLASWLAGVRSENGNWVGFDFMESALDVRVVGNTQADANDNFLMPYGDSPVTHNLPAGLRIWLERADEWHPLRLVGAHPAAQIMDWSRTMVSGNQGAAIVFDERRQASGKLSRSVVLGYPERLWISADPKAIEAIAHNALMWLLRQPATYIAGWPFPYTSAMVLAVDSPDDVIDADLDFAKSTEEAGGRATYYVLTEIAGISSETLKKLEERGHEIAYLGDRFIGFKHQTSGAQAKRLDTMREEMTTAGVKVVKGAGFHAPMESYDKVTERLLMERGFSHYVSFMDATDARMPFFAPPGEGADKPSNSLVVLPRTQGGPEDSESQGSSTNLLSTYFAEMELAEKMAALSVVRIPNQTVLEKPEIDAFFKDMNKRRNRMWVATGSKVANWWRERERVNISLDAIDSMPVLTATINKGLALQQAVTVLVNLPVAGSTLRLISTNGMPDIPKITNVDTWRAAVVLQGLAPGTYHWYLKFDNLPSSGAE